MTPQVKIGKKLKQARTAAGLTQIEVSKKAGLSVNYYARMERDEINPSLEKLQAVLKVLKIRSSEILPF